MIQPHPATLAELAWRVARQCNGGACVRVARSGDMVVIGDTKDSGAILSYSQDEFRTFVEGIRRGDFDDLL
jgi:hypothetical protein